MSNENKDQIKKKQFAITKKIAKHGSQSIIVIPRILEQQLRPGTIVELSINVLDEPFRKVPKQELYKIKSEIDGGENDK
jgi:hypothetical protein